LDIRVHKFILSKRGAEPHECEDAVGVNFGNKMFAVADGATEAFDSRTWARLLARAWVRVDPGAFEASDFGPLVRDLGIRLRRKWSRKTLPWYAEEKAQQGSFAAFVGLQIQLDAPAQNWKAVAIGDCCLIHRHSSTICETFPISDAGEFGNSPSLLPSDASAQASALKLLKCTSGSTSPGDDFLLLSDAVGCWFLSRTHEGDKGALAAFDELTATDKDGELTNFFETLRDAGAIKNDDITVVRIEIC
jgi:hypothetical protein